MLSLERTRELLNKDGGLELTDKELEEVRTLSWILAGIAYDVWLKERQEKKESASLPPSTIEDGDQ